jgi:hypothetical protein
MSMYVEHEELQSIIRRTHIVWKCLEDIQVRHKDTPEDRSI